MRHEVSPPALAAAVVVGLSLVATPDTAHATPGRGVTAVTVFDRVVGDTRYALKEITIAPGGSTGWHYHPGEVTGYIRQGVLDHYESNCSIDGVYHAGQVIVEESGPGYVHLGRNLGATPLVLDVLYRSPVGPPLAVDVPNPGCPMLDSPGSA
ncbi:cupin domain-containing protein [Saccharothrix australiensis]|uniref:Quercetin dioxygenase-like cupin family protein n=1 Tax=Saccharothrix australiensis TaxID=2072 RepID=A0A495VWZ2_9PSEU|nr:cupin domain-containing protein [Saccharothrix australiensis]RKT53749.1 quercetin dioxygenase-like cupin family protein [Saccharothrix australiensis]